MNNKLAFNKVAVAELNDSQLQAVEGGIDSVLLPLSIATLSILIQF
ncbi:bacteriocin [Flavobacterium sp. GA093]|uniref:Bacteriocin n=2 Tax=Flavobacterium hydrocarbonoxydans TaxID=2683249 RepID=A0A6I4NQQ7_9FLAO|nr:bacteriocin [Flavobacterium hydrocarbonoxydans]